MIVSNEQSLFQVKGKAVFNEGREIAGEIMLRTGGLRLFLNLQDRLF